MQIAPTMTLEGWTDQDSDKARKEGWDIWTCHGSEAGRYQLQRLDEAEILDGDAAAWSLVWRKAQEGSDIHVRALAFLKEHNPPEYTLIEQHGKEGA